MNIWWKFQVSAVLHFSITTIHLPIKPKLLPKTTIEIKNWNIFTDLKSDENKITKNWINTTLLPIYSSLRSEFKTYKHFNISTQPIMEQWYSFARNFFILAMWFILKLSIMNKELNNYIFLNLKRIDNNIIGSYFRNIFNIPTNIKM